MAKQTHLTVRLDGAEAKQIEADAAAAGVSVSAWIRGVLRERSQLDQLAAVLARELVAELPDFQAQAAEVDTKLKLISDQIHALTMIVRGSKQ